MPGNGIYTIMGGVLGSMIFQLYNFLYSPGDITKIFKTLGECIESVLKLEQFKTITGAMTMLGAGMLAVTFLMALLDKVSEGDFSIGVLFRHLLKYVFLYMVLINAVDIFNYLLQASTLELSDMENAMGSNIVAEGVKSVNKVWLINGISENIGFISKLGLFILIIVPYSISELFYIIMYFFAASRTLESVVRMACAPFVVGMSYFGKGSSLDIVRYAKKTMGTLFQIVVIFVISISLTVAQNAMITNDNDGAGNIEGSIVNPVNKLVVDDEVYEIEVHPGEWVSPQALNGVNQDDYKLYTGESIYKFVYDMMDVSHMFITIGLMLSSLFMVFKSKTISTNLFN